MSNTEVNGNGLNGHHEPAEPDYDPNFTNTVIAATGSNAHPRLAQIMPSLLRHLHDFAREVNLTVAEWSAAVDMINKAGKMSDDKRNETQLICDILGLESLVDEITSKLLRRQGSTATPSAVLGPFYRAHAPFLDSGSSIVKPDPSSTWYRLNDLDNYTTYLSGRVLSASTQCPISNALLDIWEAAPNGMYEQQDPGQPDMNLRGRFWTDAQGRFSLYCLRPKSYPVPADGPAGELLQLLNRHAYRPAHIHFIVSAEGYRTLTTQVFDAEDPYTFGDGDTVFAVKKELLVKFKARENEDGKAKWELKYDFSLGEA